ncbi:hypothetical protein HanRHA438_Chr04g0199381 [Helianthus annuus]|nr:hypothetical protein HanRHA438_Chr04g0199381 [Helianthus annuus]
MKHQCNFQKVENYRCYFNKPRILLIQKRNRVRFNAVIVTRRFQLPYLLNTVISC